MKYIVYWYDIESWNDINFNIRSKTGMFVRRMHCESIEEARLLCDSIWCNQTVAVIKDLNNNIIEVKE